MSGAHHSSMAGRSRRRARTARRSAAARGDGFALLGFRPSLVDLLRYLALHPTERVHLRRLEELFGAKSASFQRDLGALRQLGAIRRLDAAGRRVEYELATDWPLWPAIRALVARLSTPITLVREAIRGVDGVEAAFVFGSQAAGTAGPESDVDVFVLGDALDTRALHRALVEVTVLTGLQVNPVLYTRIKLAERLGRPESTSRRFLRDILAGPKAWVGGAVAALAPIVTAAGVTVTAAVASPGLPARRRRRTP